MPGEIARRPPMYLQVADVLTDEIARGVYGPGDKLPSETEMVKRFGVSRTTLRSALEVLKGTGLIEVFQGKGSTVRGGLTSIATLNRTPPGETYTLHDLPEVETPAISRLTIFGRPAHLLDMEGEDAVQVDRVLYDQTVNARIAHRMILPFSTMSEVFAEDDSPDIPMPEVFARLRTAGHPLTQIEEVGARLPLPDERTALGLTDSHSPILITFRTTHGTDGQPLICEQMKTPADRTRLSYAITLPTTRRKKNQPGRA